MASASVGRNGRNDNCLDGMACPKCLHAEPFSIVVQAWALVFDDGVSDVREIEWTDDSPCKCGTCEYMGKVRDFYPGWSELQTRDIPRGK